MADTETFAVRIPKLDRAYKNHECGISGGDMQFRRCVPAAYHDCFGLIVKQ